MCPLSRGRLIHHLKNRQVFWLVLIMIEPSRHRLVKLNSCLTQWSKRSQTVDRAADWSLQQRVLPRIFTVFPVRKFDFTRFSAAKIHKIL